MANNRITTTDLDFDQIKSNLKNYLRGQDKFSDYDFEGSGMSILLDVLAYNTHYNALYTNLAVNEAFLDSASKRASVVSKAKELGYAARSAIAATAVVDVIFERSPIDAPATYTIGRGVALSTIVNGATYTFYTVDSHTASNNNGVYDFGSITIKEGSLLTYQFAVDQSSSFTIPNNNIDLSTLKVVVQENAQSANVTTFVHAPTMIDVTGTSNVYFINEIDDGTYVIEFGDGVIGAPLVAGNVVSISYMACSFAAPNGARVFTYSGGLTGVTPYVTTTVPAFGGALPEDVDSIKWNAPRTFAAQNRCVTLEDYKTVITSRYPYIDSISVWGGEDNIPPSYGDVFISIKPASGLILSDSEKSYIIKDVIGARKVVTVHPKFVDPTYLNVELNITFYYDANSTTQTAAEISVAVRQTVADYNTQYLNKFGGILRFSKLQRMIDDSNSSITNSIVTLKVRRPIDVVYNEGVDYTIDIGNPVYNSGEPEQSLFSSAFTVLNTDRDVYFEDVPTAGSPIGAVRMFYYSGTVKVPLKTVGTIDYQNGIVTLSSVIITGTVSPVAELIFKMQSNDVVSDRNQITTIPDDMVTITGIANTAGQYQFTSSRN